jgi:CRISPR type IV-associated protein Csf2
MTQQHYEIAAFMRLLSPLHIAAPGNLGLDMSTGYMKSRRTDDQNGAMPMTETAKTRFVPQRLFDRAGANEDIHGVDTDVQMGDEEETSETGEADAPASESLKAGKIEESLGVLPIVPANNIAGRLRRYAAKEIFAILQKRGETISQSVYNTIMCGAVSGRPNRDTPDYNVYRAVREHPYLGLFGGGPDMHQRRFRVHDAVPLVDSLNNYMEALIPHSSAHLHRIKMTDLYGRMFPSTPFRMARHNRRLSDISNTENAENAKDVIENFREAISEHYAMLAEDKVAHKNGDEKKRLTTESLSAVELVMPGTEMLTRFEVDATPLQMGFFLSCLDSFCAHERIGGLVRHGFGAFMMVDGELKIGKDEKPIRDIFNSNGRINRNIPLIGEMLDAWESSKKDFDMKPILDMVVGADMRAKKAEEKAAQKAAEKAIKDAEKAAAKAAKLKKAAA